MSRHNPGTRRSDIPLDRCLCGYDRDRDRYVNNGCKRHPLRGVDFIEVQPLGSREIPYLCKPGATVTVAEYPESPDGRCLRDIRVQADLSVRELAQRLGISPADLSDLEHGRKTLRKRDWFRLLHDVLPEACASSPEEPQHG